MGRKSTPSFTSTPFRFFTLLLYFIVTYTHDVGLLGSTINHLWVVQIFAVSIFSLREPPVLMFVSCLNEDDSGSGEKRIRFGNSLCPPDH